MAKTRSNWKAVTGLFLLGAVPALPGAYLAMEILNGPPTDGSAHAFVRMEYFANPAPIILHSAAGFVFAFLMPLQFMRSLRGAGGRWHRRAGKATLVAAFLMALSAIWIILVFPPTAGPLKTAGLAATAAGMFATFGTAFVAIRRGRFALHRAWMMRGVAITFGAVTALPLAVPFAIAYAGEVPQLADGLSRWVGTAINPIYVEKLVLKTKGQIRRRSPQSGTDQKDGATI